jgi:hypothetical protein
VEEATVLPELLAVVREEDDQRAIVEFPGTKPPEQLAEAVVRVANARVVERPDLSHVVRLERAALAVLALQEAGASPDAPRRHLGPCPEHPQVRLGRAVGEHVCVRVHVEAVDEREERTGTLLVEPGEDRPIGLRGAAPAPAGGIARVGFDVAEVVVVVEAAVETEAPVEEAPVDEGNGRVAGVRSRRAAGAGWSR